MERYGFFDADRVDVDDEGNPIYDNVYLAETFAAYFASFIGNGVYARFSNKLQVMEQSPHAMAVDVFPGQAWINGYWYENTDQLSLPVEVASGTLDRVDSVVLRLNYLKKTMKLAINKGTPASTPSAPDITRNADIYEIQLAEIRIPAGSVKISQVQIKDTRANTNVCGWVTGVVDQIDTTTLFNQFEAYFAEFKEVYELDYASWTTEQKAAYTSWITMSEQQFTEWYNTHTSGWQAQFNAWFESVKSQLSGNVAAKLQLQINTLDERLEGYSSCTTTFSKDGRTITQNLQSGKTLKTEFIDDKTILQQWFSDGAKIKQKRITFSADGSVIEEVKEV